MKEFSTVWFDIKNGQFKKLYGTGSGLSDPELTQEESVHRLNGMRKKQVPESKPHAGQRHRLVYHESLRETERFDFRI